MFHAKFLACVVIMLSCKFLVASGQAGSFRQIGSTKERKYFITSPPVGDWDTAMSYCLLGQKRLLDFRSDKQMKDGLDILRKHYFVIGGELDHPPPLWTSGIFNADDRRGPLWAGADIYLKSTQLVNSSMWHWAAGEPSRPRGCLFLDFATTRTGSTKFRPGLIVPIFSTSDCATPRDIVCYHDDSLDVSKLQFNITNPIDDQERDLTEETTTVKPLSNCKPTPIPSGILIHNRGLNPLDTLKFLEYRLKMGLHMEGSEPTGRAGGKDKDIRADFINALVKITEIMCPSQFVRTDFIQLAKNYVFMYYQYFLKEGDWPTVMDESRWGSYFKRINNCTETLQPLVLQGDPFKVTAFAPSDSPDSPAEIRPVGESLDILDQTDGHTTDLIIDTLWYMYTISAGACYSTTPGDKMTFFTNYLMDFRDDFLSGFIQRWSDDGGMNYGVLFGDMELGTMMYNLRACSQAVHKLNNIEHLHYARPLLVGGSALNYKTGHSLINIEYFA